MKPRPNMATIAVVSRATVSPRAVYTRPALSCHIWQDRSRMRAYHERNWEGAACLRRYASTSGRPLAKQHREAKPPLPTKSNNTVTVPAKRTQSQPQVPILKVQEVLNPPSFTYAPDLTVPPRGRDQGFFSYIWKCGRSYLSFYKSGVSNVRQTSKLAKTLRSKRTALTRAEWQIVQRSRRDILRLPAFGLIFLVFGEWTPLLVMYITPLIPEPCRIPSQVERDLKKREARRRERQNMPLRLIERLRKRDIGKGRSSASPTVLADMRALLHFKPREATHLDLLLASARLDCHGRMWDWIQAIPPRSLLVRNMERKFKYLRKDDEMIVRHGGWQALERREVERACVERGIDVLGKGEGELRRGLGAWFGGDVSK
ncbi:hypothetical protein DE146DRAFT_661312 [Phaeosphaeria sp. MPI-PUGE-AT-0046c]|nr:hypothetical protein DE146DRAFT_661312 [Phaeosphaeria sp. MPI-PUGE-AT-0046c]